MLDPLGDQDLRVLEPVAAILGSPWQIDDWGHCNYVITRYDHLEGPHYGASVFVTDNVLRWNAGLDGIGTEDGPAVADITPDEAARWVAKTFTRISSELEEES